LRAQVFVDEKELNQNNDKKKTSFESGKAELDFRLGGGVPYGSYRSTDLQDSTAGYAQTGVNIEIFLRYSFSPLITGEAGFVGQSNRFNALPFQESLAQSLNPIYPGLQWQNDADNWTLNAFVAGVGITSPTKPVAIEGHVLGGIAFLKSPNITILASNNVGYLEFVQTEDRDAAPILGFRADAVYKFDRVKAGIFLGTWLAEGNFSSDLYINGTYIDSGSFINRFYTLTLGLSISLRIK
jgi:hypothetical protein